MAVNCEITCVKYTLFAFNFVGWIAGMAILGVGIWIATDPDLTKYADQMDFHYYYVGAYLIIAAGVITMIVGVLGCCGAINENINMLTIYFILMALILLLELAGTIYFLCVGFQYTSLDEYAKRSMYRMVNNYNNDDVRWVMDLLQTNLKCCGAMSFRDYDNVNLQAPDSCRDPITGNQFHDDCYDAFIDYVEAKSGIFVGLGVTICIIHIVAMVFSIILCLALRRENKSYD